MITVLALETPQLARLINSYRGSELPNDPRISGMVCPIVIGEDQILPTPIYPHDSGGRLIQRWFTCAHHTTTRKLQCWDLTDARIVSIGWCDDVWTPDIWTADRMPKSQRWSVVGRIGVENAVKLDRTLGHPHGRIRDLGEYYLFGLNDEREFDMVRRTLARPMIS